MRFPARPGSWALAASWMAAAGPAPPAHVARAVWVHGGARRTDIASCVPRCVP